MADTNTAQAKTDTKLDVRVYPFNDPENSTKAFASVTVADLIAIKGIRVIEGSNGPFVSMPQSKDKEGKFHDICHPIKGDLRKAINKAVLDEFKEQTKDKAADKSADKAADKAPKQTKEAKETKAASASKASKDDGPDL